MSLIFLSLMTINYIILVIIGLVVVFVIDHLQFEKKRIKRRDYYRNNYLKSDAWKRKRYVVLKRDNWKCVYCGARATQVHHKKYAKKNIGKEPIKWLVSICVKCHNAKHQ
jgi:5-methylcytosine-specific restriction endonuclease McrA